MKKTAAILLLGLVAFAMAVEDPVRELSEVEMEADVDVEDLHQRMLEEMGEDHPFARELSETGTEELETFGDEDEVLGGEEYEDFEEASNNSTENAERFERALSSVETFAESSRAISRSAYCRGCCNRCDCGCTHATNFKSHAYPSKDGKRVVVVYEDVFENYKKAVERCTPKPPVKKCVMKMVIHHANNKMEVCKECILNKKAFYNKCNKPIVIPLPPVHNLPHPPHKEKWHQVCTCTWVKNGPNYHGPRTVWHKGGDKLKMERENAIYQ